MNITEIREQIDALHEKVTRGDSDWRISSMNEGELNRELQRNWPTISAELKRLYEELEIAVFQKNLLEESFNMAMAEVDHQQAANEKAREALAANHQWHRNYDDYDGYQGSELCQMNEQALAALNRLEVSEGERKEDE